jgi:hypothetical protein
MADGPGKYDDYATHVREQTKAQGVLLVVLGGTRGHGFEFQFAVEPSPAAKYEMMRMQVAVLRDVADQIEAEMKQHVTPP